MQLTGLLDFLRDSVLYRALLVRLQNRQSLENLHVLRSARPFLLAALAQDWNGPVIYLTGRIDRAYNVSEQLPVWLGERPVFRFGEPAPMFYERTPWGENVTRSRIAALSALVPPDDFVPSAYPVVITSARAIMQRTLPVSQFRKSSMLLKVGQRHLISTLLAQWVKMGYEPASIVVEAGTFSRRGGVLDIFPLAAERPVRVEFFDDEIDSLRYFDPSSQRSAEKIEQINVVPAREGLPEGGPQLAAHLNRWFETLPLNEHDVTSPRGDAEPLANGVSFPYLEYYLPYMVAQPVSLLDYAPDNALIITEDWNELRDTVATIEEQALRTRREREEAGVLPPDYPLPYVTWDALAEELENRAHAQLGYGAYEDVDDGGEIEDENGEVIQEAPLPPTSGSTLDFRQVFTPEERFGGQLRAFLSRARKMRRDGGRVIVVTQQTARVADLWQEQDSFIPTMKNLPTAPEPHSLSLLDGTLREGWRLRRTDGDVHLVTDAEIFGWNRPEPRRRKVQRRARVPESSYADMHEGDYVVHMDYGIGRFAGMRRRTLEGNEREYLVIEYGGNDAVFVPIHQADRLTRYVGADDRPPALNRLGKPDWARVTSQAKKAVEEEAKDLLELYAKRQAVEAPAFGPDTPWQHELEAAFPYVETEDQWRAIRDVKTDLQESHPMDRLICGDVGYGKTEVALRAAFKAVNASYQVALLVPTTVLAQQHYETFSNRLVSFPIKVEMLSRFRDKENQQRVLQQLRAGEVDVIIGTHRLLQDDVTFKNLGLVIIDEEQRFGVTHKEYLKKLRTEVHVLTLTATPIPRTLYMSLTGVRDISMIQTPPEERLPIITHVGPFDDRLVRQAVMRELERGGQIFFVHNRVHSIDNLRDRLEQIVPEARIITGHGQMDERLLEKVMSSFARGEYDILLSTSIIESGIDIPNANTLIVDRADWFGMSQLYQLRGRVGRSAQQAYAYFFHPAENRLTDEARQRLEALEENTDLGSGFQIAMRDLELRGAGDILSTRQTGHVAAIGLHLYTQMLTQAVRQLKGKTPDEAAPPVSTTNITIDLPVAAYLPSDWIPEMELRLQIYRRVGGLTQLAEVAAMRDELRDRFGPLPPAVEGLLYQIEVKLLAQQANASAVINLNNVINLKLPYLPDVNREQLQRKLGEDVRVSRTAVMVPLTPDKNWRPRLLKVLQVLANGVREGAGL